ncbi:MAG: hypothetical protein FWD40_06045 [Treponema sp.]|nr:hypothetical protein [Treponema sp.]
MMAPRFLSTVIPLTLIIFISCAGQNSNVFTPVPDFTIYELDDFPIDNIGSIIDSRNMPEWLRAYIYGGNEFVEELDNYKNKYAFVAVNRGINLAQLNKWAENISARFDFPALAAERIEKRMVSSATLYPDDEYGLFFETMIKNAYNSEYPGVEKEDSHWIRVRAESEENYMYFVLMIIDRTAMQSIIRNMFARSGARINYSGNQANAVNRLRQTFFEGF